MTLCLVDTKIQFPANKYFKRAANTTLCIMYELAGSKLMKLGLDSFEIERLESDKLFQRIIVENKNSVIFVLNYTLAC